MLHLLFLLYVAVYTNMCMLSKTCKCPASRSCQHCKYRLLNLENAKISNFYPISPRASITSTPFTSPLFSTPFLTNSPSHFCSIFCPMSQILYSFARFQLQFPLLGCPSLLLSVPDLTPDIFALSWVSVLDKKFGLGSVASSG